MYFYINTGETLLNVKLTNDYFFLNNNLILIKIKNNYQIHLHISSLRKEIIQ